MFSRRALGATTALLLTWATPTFVSAQDRTEVTLEKVAPGVALSSGRGGNIGVSYGDDGALRIDDQFAPTTPAIREAVASLTEKPIRFVVNTHWHFDHTNGNENLGAAGAVILAQENVRKQEYGAVHEAAGPYGSRLYARLGRNATSCTFGVSNSPWYSSG